MEGQKGGSLLLLLIVILLVPSFYDTSEPTIPFAEAENRPDYWPAEWSSSQVICFEFPNSIWPTDEAPSREYLISANGTHISADPFAVQTHTRTCVGGWNNQTTVLEATFSAAEVAGFSIETSEAFVGIIVEHIDPGGASDEGYDWEYWFDGRNAVISADQADMGESTWIIWRIVA